MYPDPKGLSLLPFILSIFTIILIVGISVTGQIRKAVNANPIENLRNE